MKILVIGKKTSHLALRLVEEAKKLANCKLVAVEPGEIKISMKANQLKLSLDSGQKLLDFDVFYFYSIGKNALEIAELAKYLKLQGKVIVEASLAGGRLPLDKFDWREKATLPTPDYQFFFDFKTSDYAQIKYPVIVKEVHSSQGKGVFKAESRKQLQEIIKNIGTKVIIQKYLNVGLDYRVLVVGNKALGAMERIKSVNEFASNRKPEKINNVQLPAAAMKACVAASKEKGLAVAGVDLLIYRGKYYVWEINASPQCRLFEKYTGVNAPLEIIKYLQSLVVKKAKA